VEVGTQTAVVGAGIVGLATADALAAAGAAVTVYDPATPGSAQSGGDSRIFRHLHDDPRLVALACESRALWRAWEERFGVELLAADGVVALGPSVSHRLALLHAAGVRARMVDAAERAERLPLLADDVGPVLLDEDAGVIRTRAAIGALADARGRALVAEEVLAVRPTGRGTVEVRTSGGALEHERVVVCAGRGTRPLAAAVGVELPVVESAHLRLAFRLRGPRPARLACLLDGSGAFGEAGAYGDPLPGNDRFAVGVDEIAVRADGALVDPAHFVDLTERTNAYVVRALPGLVPEPVEARHCWVTELPWAHDAFAAWEHDGITFVAGNNLFKHAPALGQALARAALGDGLRAELRPSARLGAGPDRA